MRAFICGHPVAHSRSPLIHRYWLRRYGISGSYEAIDIDPADLHGFLRDLGRRGFAGGNITIPHKEAALALLDDTDPATRLIGAANTVWLEGERLCGTNTDWQGFAANLDETVPGWDKARTAVVLGAGGAARGIVYALSARGLGPIRIVNRTWLRAEALAAAFPAAAAVRWESLGDALCGADLLVNTSSLGMQGKDSIDLDLSAMNDAAIVADIVYVPLETALLRQARESGRKAVDGLGMLLHQAAPGFERWFGVRPDVTEELRDLVIADLEHKA